MTPEAQAAGAVFMRELEYMLYQAWWTSIRLRDCGELVYRHAVVNCPCGRLQSEAFEQWRRENPKLAAERDQRFAADLERRREDRSK